MCEKSNWALLNQLQYFQFVSSQPQLSWFKQQSYYAKLLFNVLV